VLEGLFKINFKEQSSFKQDVMLLGLWAVMDLNGKSLKHFFCQMKLHARLEQMENVTVAIIVEKLLLYLCLKT